MHVWLQTQKRKVVAAHNLKIKQERQEREALRQADEETNGAADGGVGKGTDRQGVGAADASDEECENITVENAIDDEGLPMLDNWLPRHMLVFSLWGPLSDDPEPELNLHESSGPAERRADESGEGGGGGDNKPEPSAVTFADVVKKLSENGAMLSRRQVAKRKKEKEEAAKRDRATVEARTALVASTRDIATEGKTLNVHMSRIAAMREAGGRITRLEKAITLYKSMGNDEMADVTSCKLLALMNKQEEADEARLSGLPPIARPRTTGVGDDGGSGNTNNDAGGGSNGGVAGSSEGDVGGDSEEVDVGSSARDA